ncbi:Phosphoserine phosphatase RsbU [Pontiella sulfatireligans]|uniref:Phosphoserine phosphatase RsbU n=2 Tax=Pontiella sulfatireligans TaxID=2750658 RepID=A0A6C2UQ84_9BACT|nr:Phosphoserine phosphatase RsbU [Pontiella sulfatireligans]
MDNDNSDYGFLLENLMDNTSDAIYFKDIESRFIMVNEACAEKHGWESLDSNIGKTDFDIFAKEHAEQAYADEQHIIKTGTPLFGIEEKETWPDGQVTWVSTTKMPMRNEAGEVIGTFGISRDITQKKAAEDRARRYADQMRAIKEEMEEEVRMAGELQKSFFRATYPAFPAAAAPDERCVDFLHRYNLNQQVSGDYCAIMRLSGTEAGIFLCDVSGLGVRAALGTALVRGIMQEIAALGLDPGAYLQKMNERLFPLLNQEGSQLSASACYLVLDATTGKIRLASAGHPLPIRFCKKGAAQWLFEDLALRGPALAVQADAAYASIDCEIDPGDAVLLFTDGLFSVCNATGDRFGKKRLLDSAHSFTGEPLEDIFDGLESDALAFSSEGRFSDDVCMVGFELRQLLPQ